MHEKVDRVEKNQKQQEKVLEKLVGDRVVGVAVWCSFCRVATHPLMECRSRKECLICFQDSHKQLVCPLRGLACMECGDSNHSALAHRVSDPVLKEVVKAKFGKNFNFIWLGIGFLINPTFRFTTNVTVDSVEEEDFRCCVFVLCGRESIFELFSCKFFLRTFALFLRMKHNEFCTIFLRNLCKTGNIFCESCAWHKILVLLNFFA